jgi:hypothetical protein
MKPSAELRLVAAILYVGLTAFLFDAVASFSRPPRSKPDAQAAPHPVVIATSLEPAQRAG